MAEEFVIPTTDDRQEKYELILPQIKALIAGETDLIANLSNVAAALKFGMSFFWVGFYLAKENQLVLGPFQGPVACTRIPFNKGVCGAAYTQQKTIIVPDVEKFPGHIACSSSSKSEIVVPLLVGAEVKLVLDVDSNQLNDFDELDRRYLEKILAFLKV